MHDGTEFANQTCLVTGGGRGLGRATAKRFRAGGATVVICDKDFGAAKSVAAELGEAAGNAYAFGVDVTDPGSVDTLRKRLSADFKIDVLVNNAGYYSSKTIREITPEEWDFVIGINLKSVFLMTRAFMDEMAARRYGRIVNIASNDAYVPKTKNCHYAAAKAGVVSLTKSFAQELAPAGVLVNGVSPGAIATDTAKAQGWLEARIPFIPVGHAAEPEDVAEVVAFLASPRNRFMAGETVIANGGLLMS
jgi:3-oxoacyl-[acyl-carrier protein] reductase